jgi:type IV pilus assembly protein PilE
MNKVNRGFTLVELMISVAIIGILAAIAIPGYSEYVDSSRRTDGQSALISLGQAMERYYTEKTTYVGASLGSGSGDIFPNAAPIDRAEKYYKLSIESQTATTFVVKATATGIHAGDGDYTLDQTGARTWKGNSGWDE